MSYYKLVQYQFYTTTNNLSFPTWRNEDNFYFTTEVYIVLDYNREWQYPDG